MVKRSGVKEPFDRAKLGRGSPGRVRPPRSATTWSTALALEIEEQLRTEGVEVPSERVGLAVLERLRALDPVSYLRFASVYKDFEDLADFEREVELLQKTTEPKRPRDRRVPAEPAGSARSRRRKPLTRMEFQWCNSSPISRSGMHRPQHVVVA